MSNLPVVFQIEGDVLGDVTVTPEGMAQMNEARVAFRELKSILLAQVVPALGGWNNPIATEIESRIETVLFGSRNFLWPHRYVGASHDAMNVGGAQ
jgi:hypothetical protein